MDNSALDVLVLLVGIGLGFMVFNFIVLVLTLHEIHMFRKDLEHWKKNL